MAQIGSKGETPYLALIGDLRQSRKSDERSLIQERLEQCLQALNEELAGELAAELAITMGDEFQGLLRRPEAALALITAYERSLSDVPTRFALGWGSLSTQLKARASLMDGPCFHAARGAMARAKAEDRWVAVSGFGEEEDAILNGIFFLIGGVRAEWTPTQAETVAAMRRAATQKDVAREREVAGSTVHKALRGALYGPVREAEESAMRLLRLFGRGGILREEPQ